MRKAAFTLVEIMISLALMAAVSAIAFLTFATVITAWQRGQAVADRLHYGDFVMEQLVTGLRSAYHNRPEHSFVLENEGDGAWSSDFIEWVKLGNALVGDDPLLSAGPHRVRFGIERDDDGHWRATARAFLLWAQQTNEVDWVKLTPIYLSAEGRITGFNCRIGRRDETRKLEWSDEWENTNEVPEFIEVTLYLEPADEDGEAIELRRVVHIHPTEGAMSPALSRRPQTPDLKVRTGPGTGGGPGSPPVLGQEP